MSKNKAEHGVYNKSATKKSRTGSKKKSKAKSTADSWRAEARQLGKDKHYQDIVCRPLRAQLDGTSPGRSNNGTVPWNPFPRMDDQGLLVVNLVPQGEGITQRRGNAIKNKSLYISGVLRCPRHIDLDNEVCQNSSTLYTAGAPAANPINGGQCDIRLVVVYDADPVDISGDYSIAMLVKDIFGADVNGNTRPRPGAYTTDATGDSYFPGALENMRGQGRFHVLANERMMFPSWTVLANAAGPSIPNDVDVMPIKRYIKLGGIGTLFRDNANPLILGSIAKGAIYCLWLSVSTITNLASVTATQAQSSPVFEGVVRLRYEE